MHRSVFCIISCILPHGMLLAQQSSHINFNGSMYSPDAGFYEIDSTARSYYQNNPDTAEGGGQAHYRTWEWFWSDRVNSPGQPPGSFQYAFDAMSALAQQPVCNTSGNIPASWQLLGPLKNSPGSTPTHNLGIIVSVAVDPSNTNIVYAGSEPASLFMAFNGSADGNADYVNLAPGGGIGLTVNSSKNVGIGTFYPNEKLQVNGNVKITQDLQVLGNATVCGEIYTTRAVIETPTCDFVFDKNYKRPTPAEKEKLYAKQSHLRGIDSASEIEEIGFDLGKNISGIILNLEENGLDIIDLYKENIALKSMIEKLRTEKEQLQFKYQTLEKRIEILENH